MADLTAPRPPPPVRRRGNRLGFWFFKTLVRLAGLRGAYALLYPVCVYYLLFDPAGVRAALAYLVRRFPNLPRWQRRAWAYRLFLSQGRTLIDRYAMVGRPDWFRFSITGYDRIRDLVEKQRTGFFLLTSHIGNWQAVLSTVGRLQRPLCFLIREDENRSVRETFDLSHALPGVRFISPEQPLGGVVEMLHAIREGYIVCIMGDRAYEFPSVQITFLGEPARFPCGAFTMAAAAECPVVVLLSARTGHAAYEVEVADIVEPRYRTDCPRRDQLRGWVQRYADVLTTYLARHPLQCFLFHDVWRDSAPAPGGTDRTPTQAASTAGVAGSPPVS